MNFDHGRIASLWSKDVAGGAVHEDLRVPLLGRAWKVGTEPVARICVAVHVEIHQNTYSNERLKRPKRNRIM